MADEQNKALGADNPLPSSVSPAAEGTQVNNLLPLGEAIRQLPAQYFRVLTHPGAAIFAEEQGKAAWNIVWVQIMGVAVLSALLSIAIFSFVVPGMLSANLAMMHQQTPQSQQAMQAIQQVINVFRTAAIPLGLSSLITTPLGYFIGIGIYFGIAKLFGGQGTFLRYMYSFLLFEVPLTILNLLVALIPILGSFISLAISVYLIILQVFMTMAVHRMSGGRATLAVLILPIILIVLAIILTFVFIVVLLNTMMPKA